MMPATICKEITIQAPAAHVWQFVGTEAGLRQWWQMDVTFEAKADGRCSEGGLFNGVPYQLEGFVTIYDPPHQLAFQLAGKQSAAELSIRMSIRITLDEVAGATVVRVVHQMSALQTSATQRHPEPVFPRPLRQIPTILNQLPGQVQPEQVLDRSRVELSQMLVDPAWIIGYDVQWTDRMSNLLKLTKIKEERQ